MREALDYLWRTFAIHPHAAMHVGAHEGQERDIYRDFGAEHVAFVEALPSVYERLKRNLAGYDRFEAVQAVCAERDGENVTFHVASNEESSSLLTMSKHKDFYPDIVEEGTFSTTTTTVDALVADRFAGIDFNMLVLDTQGAELRVLRGAEHLLGRVDAVFTEVSEVPLYEGSCTLSDLIAFFTPLGFGLKWLNINPTMFGDGLFVRNDRPSSVPAIDTYGCNVALGAQTRQSSYAPFVVPGTSAVNGKRTGGFGFHTELDDRPWFEVDLGQAQPVDEILVLNRLDVCAYRANSLQVLVRGHGGDWEMVHDRQGRPFGGVDGRPLRIAIDGRLVREVRMQLTEPGFLHLDQVEIYAPEP